MCMGPDLGTQHLDGPYSTYSTYSTFFSTYLHEIVACMSWIPSALAWGTSVSKRVGTNLGHSSPGWKLYIYPILTYLTINDPCKNRWSTNRRLTTAKICPGTVESDSPSAMPIWSLQANSPTVLQGVQSQDWLSNTKKGIQIFTIYIYTHTHIYIHIYKKYLDVYIYIYVYRSYHIEL